MSARVLVVERAQSQRPSFAESLKKRYDVVTASSGKQALAMTHDHPPRVVVLDAISMRTPGDRICQLLHEHLPTTPLIHLSPVSSGNKKSQSCADVVLVQPFTARKLVNAIERLLSNKGASNAEDTIVRGPFTLYVSRRVLLFHDQETTLTPKLSQLVEAFLRHPGETLDRKTLMSEVWDTDYLGDTRTLDVHIRWFRRAVEADPSKPVYIQTVRGVGYRLNLPPTDEAVPVPELA
ncbi:MAG: response regulator transcription factor [Anaerolineae bacterium]|nr:response regulator transcription factor [Anaerolineae bacterium]